MSSAWISLLKLALTVAVAAVNQIKPEQWAQLGVVLVAWLQNLQNVLPKGNPLFVALHEYRAPSAMLGPPKDDHEVDSWGS